MKEKLIKIISGIGNIKFHFRKREIKKEDIKKILIISLYFRGDVLFNTPAIKMLKKIFPESSIDVWVKSRSKEVLEGNSNVNRIFVFDEIKTADYNDNEKLNLKYKLNFLKKLRKESYDLCIDFTGKYSTAIFTMFGGFKNSIGINYNGFSFCYSKFVNIDTQNTTGQLTEKYLNVMKEGLGINNEDWNHLRKNFNSRCDLYISDESKKFVKELFEQLDIDENKPVICIHTTAGWKAKEWEPDNYSKLIKRLLDNYQVVLIGSESDREYNYKILDKVDIELRNFFLALSLNINSEIIRRANVFIGSDSIGLHLAGAVGTSSIGLFGPTNPLFSNPIDQKHLYIYKKLFCSASDDKQYCTRNAGKSCPTIDCMKSITIDEVLHRINFLLEKYSDDKIIQFEKN